jgi:hypothetical protein
MCWQQSQNTLIMDDFLYYLKNLEDSFVRSRLIQESRFLFLSNFPTLLGVLYAGLSNICLFSSFLPHEVSSYLYNDIFNSYPFLGIISKTQCYKIDIKELFEGKNILSD